MPVIVIDSVGTPRSYSILTGDGHARVNRANVICDIANVYSNVKKTKKTKLNLLLAHFCFSYILPLHIDMNSCLEVTLKF